VYTERVWWAQDYTSHTPGAYKFRSFFFDYSIFRDWRSDTWLTAPSHRSTGSKIFQNDVLVFARKGDYTYQTFGAFSYDRPSQQLTKKLFGAYDPTLDQSDPDLSLGVYEPEFYRQWGLPVYYCAAPGNTAEKTCYGENACSLPPYSNRNYPMPQLPH